MNSGTKVLFELSRKLILILCISFIVKSSFATNYSVSNIAELNTAIDAVAPGDTIEMEDGIWMNSDILFDANGTASSSIILKAKNPSQTILSGLSRFRISGDYLIVSGLVFENCTSINSNLIDFRRTTGDEANHSRLTDCVVKNCNPASTTEDYKWVGIHGSYNEVDHCYFENKNHEGPTLVVWTNANPGYHNIHHNYFGPSPEGDGNGWETIRVGTSTFAQNDGFNTIEHNYFYQRDGEIEIISGKSSNCTYRYNIFEECSGGFTLRHGTDCLVEGNMFIGRNKSGSYGIRLIDRDHTVINNYMEGLNHGSSSYRHPLTLMGGEASPAANGYQPNINNNVSYNTIINCTRGLMIDPDGDHPVSPDNCTLANNVIDITNHAPVTHTSTPTNTTYIGNYFYRSDGSVNVPSSGYVDIDPELSVAPGDSVYRPIATSPIVGNAVTGYGIDVIDFEAQLRSATPTVGADEISSSSVIDRGIYGPTWLDSTAIETGTEQYSVLMEAEDANWGANWSLETDSSACGFEYMLPPNMSSTSMPPITNDDLITFSFSLQTGGTYKVYARALTTAGNDDSFWVRANDGAWQRWNTINGPDYPVGYHWSQVGNWATGNSTADPVTFELDAGANTIDFSWREPGARLDKIFITNENLSIRNLVRNNSLEGQYSLKYIVENACPSDTIYFADSTNNVAFPVNDNSLEINIPLTFIGNNASQTVIDGLDLYPIFINNSDNLILLNLKLINAYSLTNGGAIINNGILQMSGVTFENNHEGSTPKAFTNNGTIYISANGEVHIRE